MRHWVTAFVTFAFTASAHAAPSFQIVSSGQGVLFGGAVSADGSTVLYTRATSGASVATFDVATGQHTAVVSSAQIYSSAISGDGSIVQGNSGGEMFQFSNGSLNIVGPSNRFPMALSDDGSIAAGGTGGQASRTTGGISGTTVLLEDLAGGGTGSFATDISADGSVLVGEGSSGSGTEAFRWASGATLGLGDLVGGSFESRATGVSADGTTVVGYGTTAAGREAFRWRDGNMVSLGDLAGGTVFSEATGVTGDGSVIVGRDMAAPGQSNAFIWDEANGLRDLQVFLTTLGIDLQSTVLHSALGISSDGQTIVGFGIQGDIPDASFPGGFRPGAGPLIWVAVIPEPNTALLLGAGLSMLARRRERYDVTGSKRD